MASQSDSQGSKKKKQKTETAPTTSASVKVPERVSTMNLIKFEQTNGKVLYLLYNTD